MSRFELNRDEIEGYVEAYLRKGVLWKPDILLVKGNARLAVIKDYAYQPFLYRIFVGIVANFHELRMYRKLEGIPGIPQAYGRVDRYAMAVEYVPGRSADECAQGELDETFFRRLKQTVEKVHARGVVLCDLRSARNIMIGDNGMPYLIDLGTAFARGWRYNPIKRRLFDLFKQADHLGIVKLKGRQSPQLMTAEEREKLARGLPWQREAVWVRDVLRRFLKKIGAIGGYHGRDKKGTS